MNLKLQYEILSIGLKNSMMELVNEKKNDKSKKSVYFYFSTYFVDDKENLKDIMNQLGMLPDEEERIKEELFLLLSFFILTLENRQPNI